MQGSKFKTTQLVYPKSNPNLIGPVIEVIFAEPENKYIVFINGNQVPYYESQLEAKKKEKPSLEHVSLSQFHAHLTALQIQHPGLSTLYSLNAARVDFIPYQFRPVLKFIRSDRPRLLIADGVGVGKTIEAGFILRELQARRDVKSVLVICPKPLVAEQKWQIEMKRFGERFTHLDGPTLRYCIKEMDIDGEWPYQHAKTILPYSLFNETLLHGVTSKGSRKRANGLLDLDPPPQFDLIIVDEAHHIRNTNTYTHQGVRFLCENAEAVLFLTATPIQLESNDLFVLLNLLRPDLIIDQESFGHMAGPNPHINRAIDFVRSKTTGWQSEARTELENAAETPWGRSILQSNPDFQLNYDLLAEEEISPTERIAIINDLEQLHTFSGIINRTRRRDIGDFTTRKCETKTVNFTQQQKQFHDDILQVQANILAQLHGNRSVNFLLTTIRRQAASCLPALAPLLQDILTRRIDELSWTEADDSFDFIDPNVISEIETQILDVLDQAENLDPNDPKLDELSKIIRHKQKLKNNKIMIFSSFRHTLGYLFDRLKEDGFRVGLVHGGTPDEERRALRGKFQLTKNEDNALDILLFSEVGCEGLDYQFCDCIVNYDLPWNPMRIEQRIGRIDRLGQRSEAVLIYNLITPGTVDADIYFRCLLRIGIFERELGASEEILGRITNEIRDVAENIQLTEEERNEKFQVMADNELRLIQEQQKLEDSQLELFGIRLTEEQAKQEIENASSYWLKAGAIRNLVLNYHRFTCGPDQEYILGDKELKTLRVSQQGRDRLLKDFQSIDRKAVQDYREWEKWLKGTNPHLSITFDSACAIENPEAAFIMPLHPLVKQAAKAFESKRNLVTAVTINDKSISPGDYPFAIYQWRFHGIREDLVLQSVSESETVTSQLVSFLEKGKPLDINPGEIEDKSIFGELDSKHYALWYRAREKHQDRTRQIVGYRKESLETSHRARIALLNEQLNNATDEKIRRMRHSQISNAEADYNRRNQELELALLKTDITAQPVAYGLLRIKWGE